MTRRTKAAILAEAQATGRAITAAEGRRLFAPKPPTEAVEAERLAQEVRKFEHLLPALQNFTAFPAEGGGGATEAIRRSHRARATRLHRQGLRVGYPDTLLDWPMAGYHGLRIELKRSVHWHASEGRPYAAGEPDPDQTAWHLRLQAAGYLVAVAWGWEPAWQLLHWYVTLRPPFRHPGFLPIIPRLRLYARDD
jgi:hypothetical protein